jgi:hypothetical protein
MEFESKNNNEGSPNHSVGFPHTRPQSGSDSIPFSDFPFGVLENRQ